MLHEIPEISIRHHCHGKPLQLGGGGGGCWVRWGDGGVRWGAVWGMGGGGRWGIWMNADRIHLPSGSSSKNLWMRLDFIQSLPPACCLQGECEERRWQGQGFHGDTSPPEIHNRTWQSSQSELFEHLLQNITIRIASRWCVRSEPFVYVMIASYSIICLCLRTILC